MTQKKKTQLKTVKNPANTGKAESVKRTETYWTEKRITTVVTVILVVMALFGTWLLVANHTFTSVYQADSYKKTTSDSSQYAAFGGGIIRYSRDGVTFLNEKNEEQWIQSGQFQNPVLDICGDSFAVGDSGGNLIQVFTKEGLKGEIETTLPIERLSVSGQGIVSAILKNDMSPSIITYDAAGNILVENQVTVGNTGYPTALEMSPDGTVLAVSYLDMSSTALKSRVICYNFSEEGKSKTNNEVSREEYENSIMPEIFFMDESHMVVVGDSSFVLYTGAGTPQKKTEIAVSQEIRSTFHTSKYIGFVLLNEEKSGYEVRLYNKAGNQVMNREISGEYSYAGMVGNEVILYSGSQCCILTSSGIQRLKCDLKTDILAVIPQNGLNKYLVMSAGELRVVYLAK